jgi:hypothetical protein
MIEWLVQHPEIKTLMVPCARARVNGALSGEAADLLEVRTTAEARYLLQSAPKGVDATGG